ncbi:MAG: flagellar hook capping protein [Epsilonproteobacteria bacterium]|nr:flagellar hook capping protein [Campylobacterota bacterium]
MAIDYSSTTDLTSTANLTTATNLTSDSPTVTNPDSILGKDDFMELLLTELQYQDPTDPMDTDKILTQTSELATLEATDNTNKALEELTKQLSASSNFNAVSAIGKMGSLGTDSITLSDDNNPTFEVYFNHDIQSGTLEIADTNGNVVKTFELSPQSGGVLSFQWDGTDDEGNRVPAGSYSVTANYSDGKTGSYSTAYGVYPIESVRFDEGDTLLKMGSNYYPLSNVKEIYQ